MELNNIELLALATIIISILKIIFLIFKIDLFMNFFENYKKSTSNYPWTFFCIYLLFSLMCLFFLRSEGISYTIIVGVTLFISFLINAGLLGMSVIELFNFDRMDWRKVWIYILIWLFIMFKAFQEIFNI